MNHSFKTTVVSCDYVWQDGVLLVEMTDDSFLTFTCPDITNSKMSWWKNYSLKYMTKEQLVKAIGEYKKDAHMNSMQISTARKVQELGADYRSRGYR